MPSSRRTAEFAGGRVAPMTFEPSLLPRTTVQQGLVTGLSTVAPVRASQAAVAGLVRSLGGSSGARPYCYIGAANPYEATMLGNYVLEGVTVPGLGPVGFNGLITAIAHQYGAHVADTFGALGTGDFVGDADCLHPNKSGHTKITTAFENASAF